MTKSDIIKKLTARADITKKVAGEFVNLMFEYFVDSLKNGEKVIIKNFGNIKPKYYDSYTGRNPKTGNTIEVEEKVMPVFKASNIMIAELNHFDK